MYAGEQKELEQKQEAKIALATQNEEEVLIAFEEKSDCLVSR